MNISAKAPASRTAQSHFRTLRLGTPFQPRIDALAKCLTLLSYRERRVLELRYGLNGEQPRTLDEVGRQFEVTRERIRQIENQGLKKLRALAESGSMRDVA